MAAELKITVTKSDLGETRRQVLENPQPLADGEVRLEVERFGLTTNNVTYALFGDALGYWAYYPETDDEGCVPVWGFAKVVESRCAEISVGEKLFGFLPMATQFVMKPADIGPLSVSDGAEHRLGLHPWYNRLFRCENDPVFREESARLQPVLWALFMTGWMLAEEIGAKADTIYVSSASSKTALSLAWSLKDQKAPARVVALTSNGNKAFVAGLGVYDDVQTYDALQVGQASGSAVFVDVAGDGALRSRLHVALDGRLTDSVTLGATHRAVADADLSMPGPEPRLFFIPAVAEERAATEGFDVSHKKFADAWHRFAPWASGWLDVAEGRGADAVEKGYRDVFAGGQPPEHAKLLSWK